MSPEIFDRMARALIARGGWTLGLAELRDSLVAAYKEALYEQVCSEAEEVRRKWGPGESE